MPVSLSLALANSNVIAGQPATIVCTVSNTTASDVTLNSLHASSDKPGCHIEQPVFLTPNRAPGDGNPTISASTGTKVVGFQVVPLAPNMPGASPNNAPGGAAPADFDSPVSNPIYYITVVGHTSDGSVFSGSLAFGALSAVAPFPRPEGGALQLIQGANLMSLTMLGAL